MKIFLCRHGQTTGDVEDRYGGDYDDHLTELGKAQGTALAKKLKRKGIEKIFTSSRIRAVETSKILSNVLNCPIEEVSDLRERNQNGILTGMVRSEAKEKYPKLVAQLTDYRNTIDGSESYESFRVRVEKTFLSLAAGREVIIAIVTHGGPIRALFRGIFNFGEIKISDCAVAEIDFSNNKFTLLSLDGIQKES